MKKIIKTLIIAISALTTIQCNNNTITSTVKLHQNDPFKNTIVPSETFEIDSKLDNILEGKNGTVVVCPKGCFKNSKGEIYEGKVEIELSEALSLEEMLLSNLTTTSDGKLLETDGMIYFNATAKGEQLTINKENPIHIEIPTSEKKPGMMAYKGIRDENGNMNWIDPKELDNFLIPVDINSLDFLPEGFPSEVEKGMPYREYKTATQALMDSLYYNLSASYSNILLQEAMDIFDNEIFSQRKKDVGEKYFSNSNLESDTLQSEESDTSQISCGIDPAIIKGIKSEKYQNTLIATKAFETRMKVIFNTCNNSVLEIYINNLDKNLYELDSMAAMAVGDNYHQDFLNFIQQRLTKVKHSNRNVALLQDYYKNQLTKVKAELEKSQKIVMKALNEKNKEVQKVADAYKKLLWKREKHRMETYGFDWSETGWINIDNGTLPKDWSKKPLEIAVTNGKQFDRVYTYVIYTSIKSLYRLNTTDKEQFYVGNDEDKEMFMPKKKLGVAVAIGYMGEIPSLAIKEFETGSEPKFSLMLLPSTLDKVKEAIRPYEKYGKENKISKDLEFMEKFYQEEQRQKVLQKESEFIFRLWEIANPCCAGRSYMVPTPEGT